MEPNQVRGERRSSERCDATSFLRLRVTRRGFIAGATGGVAAVAASTPLVFGQPTVATQISGADVKALCAVMAWLRQSDEFTSDQKKIENYRLLVQANEEQVRVHLVPLRTPRETSDLSGGEVPQGKECELTVRKRDLAISGIHFFR